MQRGQRGRWFRDRCGGLRLRCVGLGRLSQSDALSESGESESERGRATAGIGVVGTSVRCWASSFLRDRKDLEGVLLSALPCSARAKGKIDCLADLAHLSGLRMSASVGAWSWPSRAR